MSEKRKKFKKLEDSSEESDSSSLSSSLTSSSDDETEAKDLKPIKEYLSDRKELASQLFKSVKAEKIRMMLPQILKKVDFTDLEELCAAELIGMSKARIMSIINGQQMLQSSDTEESDESGPSLEIISDTEWISDASLKIKEEGVNSKNNKDVKRLKKKPEDQKKKDNKNKIKSKGKEKVLKEKSNVKVKMEKVKLDTKEKEKEKDGESLLDLLELEMRARAIRALIRKEEDQALNSNVTNTNSDATATASGSGTSNGKNVNSRQANLKEQLEKIDILMKHGEDEDVFVVIQPAPTIELLSSESEGEDNSKRVNHKLVNERKSKDAAVEKKQSNKDENTKTVKVTIDKKDVSNDVNKDQKEKTELTKNENADKNDKEKTHVENKNSDLPVNANKSNDKKSIDDNLESAKVEDLEDGEIVDDNDNNTNIKQKTKPTVVDDSTSNRVDNKVKKRYRKQNELCSNESIKSIAAAIKLDSCRSQNKKNNSKQPSVRIDYEEPIEIEDSPKRNDNTETTLNISESKAASISKPDLFDDKSLDAEEVINLDDYPDDMYALEQSDADKEKTDDDTSLETVTKEAVNETWATRYYQQDDVQNVIRESKIQSEIRKRLRERQRQRKMNNSPKLKDQEPLQSNISTIILKPTGSVEEYLSLKGHSSTAKDSITESKTENSEAIESLKECDSQHSSNSSVKQANLLGNDDQITDQLSNQNLINTNKNLINLNKIENIEQSNKCILQCDEGKMTGNAKPIIIKDDSLLKDKKVILVKESPKKLKDGDQKIGDDIIQEIHSGQISPLREDIHIKNDSSNDTIVLKTDIFPNHATLSTKSTEETTNQIDQSLITELNTSDLPPD